MAALREAFARTARILQSQEVTRVEPGIKSPLIPRRIAQASAL
jgi:hypothetical protein